MSSGVPRARLSGGVLDRGVTNVGPVSCDQVLHVRRYSPADINGDRRSLSGNRRRGIELAASTGDLPAGKRVGVAGSFPGRLDPEGIDQPRSARPEVTGSSRVCDGSVDAVPVLREW